MSKTALTFIVAVIVIIIFVTAVPPVIVAQRKKPQNRVSTKKPAVGMTAPSKSPLQCTSPANAATVQMTYLVTGREGFRLDQIRQQQYRCFRRLD
jgi:hypothetical protein